MQVQGYVKGDGGRSGIDPFDFAPALTLHSGIFIKNVRTSAEESQDFQLEKGHTSDWKEFD